MQFNYLELCETVIHCPGCSWIGFGRQAILDKGAFLFAADIICPSCSIILGLCILPVDDGPAINSKAVESENKESVFLKKEKEEYKKLKDPSQLKDINDENIFLIWSLAGYEKHSETVRILYHTEIIWEEPLWFECYDRFIQIAKILKAKYCRRLKDLIPSDNSYAYLYGDNFNADEIISEVRKQIRDNTLI